MAIVYRIYKGDAAGGPVDYATIVATVTGLSHVAAALPLSSTTRFAVRAYDNVTGIEHDSVDAEVAITVNSAGGDASDTPGPVRFLRARATANASIVVEWSHDGPDDATAPAGFRVYAGAPTVSYASPLATVTYWGRGRAYRATLSGLTGGSTYQIAVRPYNAAGEQTTSPIVTATADATGPPAPEGLAGAAVD